MCTSATLTPDAHEIKGEDIVCFAVLKPGNTPSEDLRKELKALIEKEMGKTLRPQDVKFVRDLPKTRNAKIMRRLIRARFLGQPPGDTSSLENPDAVEEISRAIQARMSSVARNSHEESKRDKKGTGYFLIERY